MKFRRIALWAVIDVLGTSLGVALMSVHPVAAKVDGVKPHAEFLIQMDYDVTRDVDLDLWVVGPERKPVFYNSRQVGCADLDRDSLGLATAHVYLADGTSVLSKSNIETTTIRCIAPGRYDVAVNVFSYHTDSREPIKAHIEITGLNPQVRTLFAADFTLTHLGETENVASFDLDKDGQVTLVSVPLEPITQTFEKSAP